MILPLLLGALSLTQTDAPVPSAHTKGPNGLEAWTLNWTIPDQGDDRFPMDLIIARHGKILRHIQGDPFLWRWIFLDQGRKVAYEAAPFHSSSHCILRSIATGKQLDDYNCFPNPLPPQAPTWVKTLQQAKTADDLPSSK